MTAAIVGLSDLRIGTPQVSREATTRFRGTPGFRGVVRPRHTHLQVNSPGLAFAKSPPVMRHGGNDDAEDSTRRAGGPSYFVAERPSPARAAAGVTPAPGRRAGPAPVRSGFEESDSRGPGRSPVSREPRGGRHDAGELPWLHPRVDPQRTGPRLGRGSSRMRVALRRTDKCPRSSGPSPGERTGRDVMRMTLRDGYRLHWPCAVLLTGVALVMARPAPAQDVSSQTLVYATYGRQSTAGKVFKTIRSKRSSRTTTSAEVSGFSAAFISSADPGVRTCFQIANPP